MTREETMAKIAKLRGDIAKHKWNIESLEDEIKYLQERIDETEVEKRIRIVCEATGISRKDIFGKSRLSEIVEARHLLCYSLRETMTTSDVGRIVGLDHSSVVHAVKKIKDLLSINDKRTVELIGKIDNYE